MEGRTAIRLYHQDEEEAINDLFNSVFQLHRPLLHWRWKFLETGAAPVPLIYVAENDGKLVGAFPTIPVRFQVADRTLVVAQSVDNCILPEYRKGGTQRSMYRAFADRMREMGAGFVFGFPNEMHFKVGKKLFGYRDLCPLSILQKRLNFRRAVRLRIPSKSLERLAARVSNWGYRLRYARGYAVSSEIQIEPVSQFDAAFDVFWQEVSRLFPILTVRDRSYLQWRYGTNPNAPFSVLRAARDGQMAGYLISKTTESDSGERSTNILDLLTLDNAVSRALIRRAIVLALDDRADNMKIGLLKHNPDWDVLWSEGFVDKSQSRIAAYVMYDQSLESLGLTQAANWFLTLGDTDFLG